MTLEKEKKEEGDEEGRSVGRESGRSDYWDAVVGCCHGQKREHVEVEPKSPKVYFN